RLPDAADRAPPPPADRADHTRAHAAGRAARPGRRPAGGVPRPRHADQRAGAAAVNGAELALLGRTAAHLRPAQVAHRARLRAQRAALRAWPQAGQRLLAGPRAVNPPGWPRDFTPLDGTALTMTFPAHWPSLADLAAGRVWLLGRRGDVLGPD